MLLDVVSVNQYTNYFTSIWFGKWLTRTISKFRKDDVLTRYKQFKNRIIVHPFYNLYSKLYSVFIWILITKHQMIMCNVKAHGWWTQLSPTVTQLLSALRGVLGSFHLLFSSQQTFKNVVPLDSCCGRQFFNFAFNLQRGLSDFIRW